MHEIHFHRPKQPWGCFAAGSEHAIELDGCVWPTAAHYVLAQRLPDEDSRRDRIRASASLAEAQRVALTAVEDVRGDWSRVRDGVMYRVLLAKFSQHEDLRSTLLDSHPAVLVEHAHGDPYWGDAGDGTGQNMLGRTLMAVREELRRRPSVRLTVGGGDERG